MRGVFAKAPHHANIIIGGDINLADISWDIDIPTANNPSTAYQPFKSFQIMDDYSLCQNCKSSHSTHIWQGFGFVIDLLSKLNWGHICDKMPCYCIA